MHTAGTPHTHHCMHTAYTPLHVHRICRLELVHRAPLLADETTPVLLLLRMHGDACVDGEIAVSIAPPPAAEAAAAAAATTAAAAALGSPTAAPAAAATAVAAPPADVPTMDSGTLLTDELGVPITAPLPLPLLGAQATHAVALRLSIAAAGTLHLVATVRYRPPGGPCPDPNPNPNPNPKPKPEPKPKPNPNQVRYRPADGAPPQTVSATFGLEAVAALELRSTLLLTAAQQRQPYLCAGQPVRLLTRACCVASPPVRPRLPSRYALRVHCACTEGALRVHCVCACSGARDAHCVCSAHCIHSNACTLHALSTCTACGARRCGCASTRSASSPPPPRQKAGRCCGSSRR